MSKSLEHNRSLKMIMSIEKSPTRRGCEVKDVEALLQEHYETGTGKEGVDAYPALMLLKAMLLQKWFRIPSDPEFENRFNDRQGFAFIQGPFSPVYKGCNTESGTVRSCGIFEMSRR